MAKRKKKKAETEDEQPRQKSAGYKLNFEPRSTMQRDVLKTIMDHDLIFLTGPTGTGKTFLAVVAALRCIYNRRHPIKKLIVVRPAVAAQEDIGFLPGDVNEKLAYFVAPIYDHIIKLVGNVEFRHLMEKEQIEIIPVGYLRGRNFENAFVILDEAQNANKDQLLLTITRIAENAKIVVCGDTDQLDIYHKDSGLVDAIPRFIDDPEPEIAIITLPETEIQRHPLVAKILAKYKAKPEDSTATDMKADEPQEAVSLDELDSEVQS